MGILPVARGPAGAITSPLVDVSQTYVSDEEVVPSLEEDARQEAMQATSREQDPYRVSESILADGAVSAPS